MADLPEHACIIADWSLWTVLQFMQKHENVRPDVLVLFLENNSPVEVLKKHPDKRIFCADNIKEYNLDKLPSGTRLEKKGIVYEIKKNDTP